jgi:pimeloyl-ACP methyl ester carboxylesterase
MKEESILIKDLKISYRTAGEGRPLLILHGWGSKKEKWQQAERILSRSNLKVIIPDLPGFGQSSEPLRAWNLDDYCDFVEEFVKSLNMESFYLLGHSFGGALAVKCSLRFPEKVEKMFLVAAACFRGKTLKKDALTSVSKALKVFSFIPFYPLFRKAFYKFIVKSDYLGLEGIMRETYLKVINQDLSNDLALVKVPTIIIWGSKDDVTPIKQAYLLNKKINNSELKIIPNAGHDLEWKMPKELSQLIIQ